MRPSEAAAERGIEQILHYTTRNGILGVLAKGAIASRARLNKDDYLEHIFKEVCAVRKDHAWLDYISLSVSRINFDLFSIASNRWHTEPDMWWAVLALDVSILDDEGVVFATTNNIYPAVRHGTGVEGFEALFADPVAGRYGVPTPRDHQQPNEPTDRQAEVLYPGEISTERLLRLYVADVAHRRIVLAQCEAVGHHELDVVVRPDVFA